jgi:hypothetical protein
LMMNNYQFIIFSARQTNNLYLIISINP